MKTIAFFSIPAYGHTRPTLPVVEELVRRGCRVVYYINEEFREAVAATGAEVRVIPNDSGMPQSLPRTGMGLIALLLQQTYQLLPMLVTEMDAENVGVVVHDSFSGWGMGTAQLTGRPSVRTCSVFIGAVPRPPGKNPVAGIWWFLRNEFSLLAWLRFRTYRRKLIAEFGLQGLRLGITSADRTIVFTSKELMPNSELLDDRTQFIGASFSDTGAPELAIPDPGDRPLVYISLGTTFTNEPGFFQMCKDAFGAEDVRVVLSLGNHVDPKTLEPWPENFTVAPYLPQLEVLKKASVFVMQAGGCSVMEALWHGVPMVMVPLIPEHWFNTRLIVPTGAGIVLRKEDLTSERLAQTTLAVHADPRYREAAMRMGETLRAAGGPKRGADTILDLCPDARPANG